MAARPLRCGCAPHDLNKMNGDAGGHKGPHSPHHPLPPLRVMGVSLSGVMVIGRPQGASLLDYRRPANIRVGEDIELVAAARGKLRDNRAPVACLEPVPCIGRNSVLLAWLQHDLMPDSIGMFA